MGAMLPVAMAKGSGPANADLSAVSLDHGALSPVFDPGVAAYAVTIDPQVCGVTVTPALADANASFTIMGRQVASLWVNVNPGQTKPVTIEVTAQDGAAKKVYTVNVTRTAPQQGKLAGLAVSTGTLSPAFLPLTRVYTLAMDENTSSVTVTPEKGYASDIVRINGKLASSLTVKMPQKGTSRIIAVTVKSGAKHHVTGMYFIRIVRAKSSGADLKSIKTVPGGQVAGFNANTLAYSVNIPYKRPVVLVQPAALDRGSKVFIDGRKVSARTYRLTPGVAKTVTIQVQSQDGKNTKTYTLTLSRSAK
jgi:hypothetical protein